jgi:F-type H+-transporting ATPase subunit delta
LLRDPASKRYAQAAFELARDKGELDAWERELADVGEVLQAPGVIDFLSSVRAPNEAKLAFLQQAMGQASPLVWNFMRLLTDRNRLNLLPQIVESFQALVDDERGIAHAQVTTAVPLSEDERNAVARRLSELTGKQVRVETAEDEQLIGGMVARIGDRLIDGSTRSKLIELKRQLAGSNR